jgi:hypothetical protein
MFANGEQAGITAEVFGSERRASVLPFPKKTAHKRDLRGTINGGIFQL